MPRASTNRLKRRQQRLLPATHVRDFHPRYPNGPGRSCPVRLGRRAVYRGFAGKTRARPANPGPRSQAARHRGRRHSRRHSPLPAGRQRRRETRPSGRRPRPSTNPSTVSFSKAWLQNISRSWPRPLHNVPSAPSPPKVCSSLSSPARKSPASRDLPRSPRLIRNNSRAGQPALQVRDC